MEPQPKAIMVVERMGEFLPRMMKVWFYTPEAAMWCESRLGRYGTSIKEPYADFYNVFVSPGYDVDEVAEYIMRVAIGDFEMEADDAS